MRPGGPNRDRRFVALPDPRASRLRSPWAAAHAGEASKISWLAAAAGDDSRVPLGTGRPKRGSRGMTSTGEEPRWIVRGSPDNET